MVTIPTALVILMLYDQTMGVELMKLLCPGKKRQKQIVPEEKFVYDNADPWLVLAPTYQNIMKGPFYAGGLVRVRNDMETSDIIIGTAPFWTKEWRAFFEVGYLKTPSLKTHSFNVPISSVTNVKCNIHRQYAEIAIIKLGKRIDFGASMKPLRLPWWGENDEQALKPTSGVSAGSLYHNKKEEKVEYKYSWHRLEMEITDASSCRRNPDLNEDKMICAVPTTPMSRCNRVMPVEGTPFVAGDDVFYGIHYHRNIAKVEKGEWFLKLAPCMKQIWKVVTTVSDVYKGNVVYK